MVKKHSLSCTHIFFLQDAQLNTVRAELSEMKAKYSNTDVTLEELTRQIQQLKDQNALLKAHRG